MAHVKVAPKALPPITRAEVDALNASRHVVYIYPRKKLVLVDGFKRYRLAD